MEKELDVMEQFIDEFLVAQHGKTVENGNVSGDNIPETVLDTDYECMPLLSYAS